MTTEIKKIPKLIISNSVLNQIRSLCNKFPTQEWSGLLWYDRTGDLTSPDDITFTLKFITPLDLGSGSHTVYKGEIVQECVQKMADHDISYIRTPYGHVHSHNKMGVFFSGEDKSTLEDGPVEYYIFLSLIVNNAGDMTAKFAYKEKIAGTISVLNADNNWEVQKNVEYERVVSKDVDIVYESVQDNFFQEFITELEKPKYVPPPFHTIQGNTNMGLGNSHYGNPGGTTISYVRTNKNSKAKGKSKKELTDDEIEALITLVWDSQDKDPTMVTAEYIYTSLTSNFHMHIDNIQRFQDILSNFSALFCFDETGKISKDYKNFMNLCNSGIRKIMNKCEDNREYKFHFNLRALSAVVDSVLEECQQLSIT